MQNAVVDTNVLVRALLKPDSSDGIVVRRAFDDRLCIWYSERIIREFIRVLSYPRLEKYHITKERAEVFLELFITQGKIITPHITKLCRDLDDNEILGIALAAVATTNASIALVSADKDLLVLKGSVEGVRIMKPQEFLRETPIK
ncbi:putative toxin-antitoxin system toxin component, PIN family [Candidatus Gottesmanbacteria bacterium]|nr:putative toxin-antitoxin system toxin component, PIN family [Candidatus Gottesmanbacteria bacterium]